MLVTRNTKLTYINSRGKQMELSPFSLFFLQKCEEELENEITAEKQSANHGETYVGSSLGSGRIELDGFVDSKTNIEEIRREIIKVFNPTLDGKLIYTNSIMGKDKVIEVKVESVPTVIWDKQLMRFSIDLIAHNPFWKEQEKTEYIALLTKKLTFPLVVYNKMVFGIRKSTLETQVENIGDVESGFRVVFKARSGTVVNPKLFNKVTGEYIKINYTMEKGDMIEVINYPELKKITVNHSVNGFKCLDIDSTFFNLDVGKNLIGYLADENTINLDVIMYYTPRYLGV